MTKGDIKVVFFGTGEFAVPIVEKLALSPWRPDWVVTTPDAPAGRGLNSKPAPVKVAAERLGIPVIQPEDLKIVPRLEGPGSRPTRIGLGRNWKLKIPEADLFIVAAYGQILPAELLKIPRHGSLNVHPSLLPRWRGPAPIQYAILHGDEETGVTVMLMDEDVDHGALLRYEKLNIKNQKWTTPELAKKLAALGAGLLLETIPDWLAGKIQPQTQDESRATYAKKLKKEDGCINWSKDADEIERMVRAFQPWPGAYTFWQRPSNRVRLAIEGARCGAQGAGDKTIPAGMVFRSESGLAASTGKGLLIIERLRPEGRKSMSAAEFLRGYPDIIGAKLT